MIKKWIAQIVLNLIKEHLDTEVCNANPDPMEGYQPDPIPSELIALSPGEQPGGALFDLEEPHNLIAHQGGRVTAHALRVVSQGAFHENPSPVLILPKPALPAGESSNPDRKIKGLCFSEAGDEIVYEIDHDGVLWFVNQFQLSPGTEVYLHFPGYLAAAPLSIASPATLGL